MKSKKNVDFDKFRYKIEGYVNTDQGLHSAIWLTDTISFDGDTVFYQNSDSSIVRIAPPYVISVRGASYKK